MNISFSLGKGGSNVKKSVSKPALFVDHQERDADGDGVERQRTSISRNDSRSILRDSSRMPAAAAGDGVVLDALAKPTSKEPEVVAIPCKPNTFQGPGAKRTQSDDISRVDLDEYKDEPGVGGGTVSVEGFGEALLLGMGWKKGEALGKRGKITQPIEYIPRFYRCGLGATPRPPSPDQKKHIRRPGDPKEPRPTHYEPIRDADGHVRHYRTIDEKLKPGKYDSSNHTKRS